ncbi:DUF1491 family protein [Glacieibacterium megasporae]|uniref:DUF1491 family protein n=1 Tax=Glacieibacterium megasporae TaxID=2835787 RepID=UPI001C1E82A2|nr:DUF1491 family protein [Polymorphobacter megasporae]UAJ10904.1 DUF1491 family protein [Polymorphobacter megasporae]
MSEPRLSAGTWTSALLRRVDAAGDFATVVHRGDAVAGSVVLIHRDRSGSVRALSRALGESGSYVWRTAATGDSVDSWVSRQRGFDPDLWVIELDTPDPARFIDETID